MFDQLNQDSEFVRILVRKTDLSEDKIKKVLREVNYYLEENFLKIIDSEKFTQEYCNTCDWYFNCDGCEKNKE